MDGENTTQRIERCLARLLKGDPAARRDLVQEAYTRLQRQVRSIMRLFPNVEIHTEDESVLNSAAGRLLAVLEKEEPPEFANARMFFQYTRQVISSVMLDKARRLKRDIAYVEDCQNGEVKSNSNAGEFHKLAAKLDVYEKIASLPDEQKEILELSMYWDLTKSEIADLLQIGVKTVRKRLRDAKIALSSGLGGYDTAD